MIDGNRTRAYEGHNLAPYHLATITTDHSQRERNRTSISPAQTERTTTVLHADGRSRGS